MNNFTHEKRVSYRLADKHFIYRFLGFGFITSQALSSLWLQLKVYVFKHNLFSGWTKNWQIQRTVWALSTEFARIVKYAHGAFFSPSYPLSPRRNGLIAVSSPRKNNGNKLLLRLNMLTCEVIAIHIWKPSLGHVIFCINLSFSYSKWLYMSGKKAMVKLKCHL